MLRREFLFGSTLVGIAAAFPRLALAQNIFPELPRLIDAHCHVFNARDLPIKAFIEKCVIQNGDRLNKKYRDYTNKYAESIDWFLTYIADRLSAQSFSVSDELKQIAKVQADAKNRRSNQEKSERDIDFLAGLIEDLKSERMPGAGIERKFLPAYMPGIVVALIHRETFPCKYRKRGQNPLKCEFQESPSFVLGDILGNADEAYDNDKWEDSAELAKRLYENPWRPIGYYLKWACMLTWYRYELVEELQKIHHNRAVLVTPALVDYGKWLDLAEDEEPTSMGDQVQAMGAIARMKPVSGSPRVHGFVGYDPLRQSIHEKRGLDANKSPLKIVQDAIEKDGFIGVKLYPPMGFRPLNNEGAGDDFPCWVRFGHGSEGYKPRCDSKTNASGVLGNEPGKRLDDAMKELYAWCVSQDVPILSHTNDSNGSGPGYSTRANPRYWEAVIANRDFEKLRVSLAHFGGFNALFDADGEAHEDRFNKTWEATIGSLWRRYPSCNVYADISYFSEILNGDQCNNSNNCRLNLIIRMTKRFVQGFPQAKQRLIYGTDWIMTGLERKFPLDDAKLAYPDLVARFVREVGLDPDEVMFKNTARFLGLDDPGQQKGSRARLKQFYTEAGLDPGWLEGFNA